MMTHKPKGQYFHDETVPIVVINGTKIQRENGFQFGKNRGDKLTYTHIGTHQTYINKIKNLIKGK